MSLPKGKSSGVDRRAPVVRAMVLHPDFGQKKQKRLPTARLEEISGLSCAIGLEPVHREIIPVSRPRPATLFGPGVVERLGALAQGIDLAVVDTSLTPVQQRNLERVWTCKVIDRTGLILEIFGQRARTREGKLQVDLALLSYQRSRLVRSWTHLERQRGGAGFMGGPGERQIELDRRMIDERIVHLKADLDQVRRTRDLHRQSRRKVPFPIVALVGYTNAGKSTLFNRLTQARVLAQDLLFATLDPTLRRLTLPAGREVILSDTVGFISDLPTDLVAAFRATLEEVLESDILVHVRDFSHADSAAQKQDVMDVLRDLMGDSLDQRNILELWNKIDLIDDEERTALDGLTAREEWVVPCSAVTGEGTAELLTAIETALDEKNPRLDYFVPYAQGTVLSWLHENGTVLNQEHKDNGVLVSLRLSPAAQDRCAAHFHLTPV